MIVTAEAPAAGITLSNGLCTRVIDGDTIKVSWTFELPVRLLKDGKFLDAPEKTDRGGQKSWKQLEKEALGKTVTVHFPIVKSIEHMMSFSRPKGEAWIAGEKESLSDWQIEHGNAVVAEE